MYYLMIGLLVSIGFGIGKLLMDILSEIVFTRLHNNSIYKVICKKTEEDIKSKRKKTIGFCSNNVK